jgi:hypothetical protein
MRTNFAWAAFAFLVSVTAKELRFKVGPNEQFTTVDAALTASRAERNAGDTVRFTISGTHFLQKPIALTESDSRSTFEGEATLSGGKRLGAPRLNAAGSWEWEIPDVREGKWYFRQLFVNDERRQRARTPNSGYFRIQGDSPQDKPIKLKFKPGDIKKDWAEDGDVEAVAYLAWADVRMQIRAVDEAASVATLSGNPRPSNREANAQYFIENAPDGLDQPGEWHLNRKTGVLRYWPLPGENPTETEVIAPVLEELVTVRGNPDTKNAVEKIAFRGLTFAHTDYALPTNGLADTQAAVAIGGDLLFEFARDCVVEDCRFINLAGYGIEAGRGAQAIKIQRCEVFEVGGGGVRIGETARRQDAFDATHSNEVIDCELHKLGRIFAPAVGVFILQSATNRVAHNHIHDLYYTAVSVGWNWGYQDSPVRANIVEFNHMHDIGQFLLSDMGAVYTLGIQPGTIIRNNLIHDVNAFTYGGWGLYPDEGSTGILLENNVVYRCKSAGFHQHYGRDNIVRNNIFAFGKEHQLMRTREEAHNSFTFERNIVYFDSGDLLGSNWSNDKFTINNNLYFDTRTTNVMFKNASLAQWQARGHDTNSVIADPLFRDTAKFDFRLKENSPALKLGFKPIDLSTVGPRKQRR